MITELRADTPQACLPHTLINSNMCADIFTDRRTRTKLRQSLPSVSCNDVSAMWQRLKEASAVVLYPVRIRCLKSLSNCSPKAAMKGETDRRGERRERARLHRQPRSSHDTSLPLNERPFKARTTPATQCLSGILPSREGKREASGDSKNTPTTPKIQAQIKRQKGHQESK